MQLVQSGTGGVRGLFGASMSAVPTAASTGFNTWWYQWTGSTYTDGEQGPLIITPTTAGAGNYTARSKPAPATPYTIDLLLAAQFPIPTTNISAGMYVGWGEAATGAANKGDLVLTYPGQLSQMYRDTQTNATTQAGHTTLSAGIQGYPNRQWWRLSDDGTTAVISISATGDPASFQPVLTVTKAGSFLGASGYNHILFGCVATAGSGSVQLLSYKQT
jgi:hypothetical protein